MKHGVLLSTRSICSRQFIPVASTHHIDIDSIEVPILDGPAEPFRQMLEQAGTRRLRRNVGYLKVLEAAGSDRGDRRIGIYPAMNFVFAAMWISASLVGQQEWKCWSAQRLAICWPAPTFVSSAIFSRYAPLGSFARFAGQCHRSTAMES